MLTLTSMEKLHRYESPRVCVLAITGEDAFTYLQSQFSNDLKRATEQPVTYGLFLDRKGKVLADAFILQRGPEDLLLVSYDTDPGRMIEIVESNLIADEVELEDVSDQYDLVTLWGEETLLSAYLPEPGSYRELDNTLVFRGRRLAAPHAECLVPANENWPDDEVVSPAQPDAIAAWNELNAIRIRDGLPSIPFDIGPGDLPQEGGDLASVAVSYTKGCYLGQEVMARLHSMGKAQRALYRVRLPQAAERHEAIFVGEKKVGELRSLVPVDSASFLGLALLKRRAVAEQGLLRGFPIEIEDEITG